jgi:hypothetical protein
VGLQPPSPNDFLCMVLPLYEAILNLITGFERLWELMHRCSYSLPRLDQIEARDKGLIAPRDFDWYQSPIPIHHVNVKYKKNEYFKDYANQYLCKF